MPVPPVTDTLPLLDRAALRRALRRRRRALSRAAQRAAAERVATLLARHAEFTSARHIAVYLAADGELNPSAVIRRAWAAGKAVYLPVLVAGGRLRFARYRPGTRLRRNRLGLAEPVVRHYREARLLDLVLMPLVGFDRDGGRLGMGGGFYDRSFAFLAGSGRRRPRLVGLAHALQQVATLPIEAWDVPMAAVATDRGWIRVRSGDLS